eukprot:SAG11_NODE_4196_length_2020_cov_1.121291_2_plen_96_part_00
MLHDLRIGDPFPELAELCDGFDIDVEDSTAHAHVPWLVILYKCLEEWRALEENSGKDRPTTWPEKRGFKALVRLDIARLSSALRPGGYCVHGACA